MKVTKKELEKLKELVSEHKEEKEKDEDPGVDYAEEFRRQTGRDLETGEYVDQ